MKSTKKNKITINRVVATSFLVDVSDVILNVVIAIVTGSVVMLTQAFQGSSDLVSAGLLLVGVRRSQLPSTRRHPFGFGKELYFWAMMAALTMFGVTATLSVYYGYKRLVAPEPISRANLAILVLAISLVTNGYSFSLSLRRLLGKKDLSKLWLTFRHSSLVETKTTLVLDAMGTLASIFGIVALGIYGITGNSYFDGLGAIVIGVMLYVLSFMLLMALKDMVIGKSAPEDVQEKIKKSALGTKEVNKILDLRTMYLGPNKLLINMEVNLKNDLSTDEIEKLIDEIKTRIRREVPSAGHVQIELESE